MSIVLDTNIWVAARFNPESSSARIVQAIKDGRYQLVWDEATKAETRRILERIPPISWNAIERLFTPETKFTGEVHPEDFTVVEDGEDRKFAALAAAAGAVLISNDAHLLSVRERLDIDVLTPGEFVNLP